MGDYREKLEIKGKPWNLLLSPGPTALAETFPTREEVQLDINEKDINENKNYGPSPDKSPLTRPAVSTVSKHKNIPNIPETKQFRQAHPNPRQQRRSCCRHTLPRAHAKAPARQSDSHSVSSANLERCFPHFALCPFSAATNRRLMASRLQIGGSPAATSIRHPIRPQRAVTRGRSRSRTLSGHFAMIPRYYSNCPP